jgi:diguanylate cyclase (GGDEF)-like protein/PAS domain S-box-containing protein
MNDTSLILIVDDDATGRVTMRAALEPLGYEVLECSDGEEALRLFSERRPDLVVLDVVMPGLDGFETCARMRLSGTERQTPILMLTGLDDGESIDRAFEVGATDFATKPVNFGLLGHRVRYLLRAHRTLVRLGESESWLAQAQRLAHIGHWQWDPVTGVHRLSPEIARILGMPEGEATTRQAYVNALNSHDRSRLLRCHDELARNGGRYSVELRLTREDGELRVVRDQGEAVGGEDGRALLKGTIQDITELRLAENHLRYLSDHDALTGLPNRKTFDAWLDRTLASAAGRGEKVAVLCIDMDNFRRVNESMGHGQGDVLLREVAGRLAHALEGSGLGEGGRAILARAAGDEFLLALAGLAHAEDAARMAERVLTAFRKGYRIEETEVFLAASIGIAMFPDDSDVAEAVVSRAASAVRHTKKIGGSSYRFYDASMQWHSVRRLGLEADLRRAVERSEFRLFLQPQIDLRSRRVVGAEALLRWQHPERGLVPPLDFIPFAEETGLIVPIGEWMLNEVCSTLAAWRTAGHSLLSVAVNVSPREFVDPGLAERVRVVLARYGLAPDGIEMEITETCLMADKDTARETLRDLRGIGVRVCLDDFGMGYSSFSYLKHFAVDSLKVDRSFVKDVVTSRQDRAIVAAILAISQGLGLGVVVEGVEQEAQLEVLQSLGSRVFQGYLFSKPVPAAEFEDRLREGEAATPAAAVQNPAG